jgi:hypothetical protein
VRKKSLIVAAVFALSTAAAAHAAPTCQTRDGDAIKCGVLGAMPVGWQPPNENSNGPMITADQMDNAVLAALLILGFVSLIALMPEFDGANEGDWDRQECDHHSPRRR